MTSVEQAGVEFLWRWSLLLALGWGVHAWCRRAHPRWRLLLWRSVLGMGLLLPLGALAPLPRWDVTPPRLGSIREIARESPRVERAAPPVPRVLPSGESHRPTMVHEADRVPAARVIAPASGGKVSYGVVLAGIPWRTILFAGWMAGVLAELSRLVRVSLTLRRWVRRSRPAGAWLQTRAHRMQMELGIRRRVEPRISDEVVAPFLCGVWNPVILIPRRLAESMGDDEIEVLLAHELAHQVRHDLWWLTAWRIARAIFWFHPLVWKVPDAHVLACEEEADRTAAARSAEPARYAPVLARLALRVIGEPGPERRLVLNATSHLARRLAQLAKASAGSWRRWHSVTGVVGVMGLFVCTAGWQFAQPTAATRAEEKPAVVRSDQVTVLVQDEQGRPVAGARITPDGLRGQGGAGSGSHFGWRPSVHGPAIPVVTDDTGRARLTFPKAINAEEKFLTGQVSFTVNHPEFSAVRPTSFPVDGSGGAILLKRGIPIRVSGYYGPERQPVSDLVPLLLGESRPLPAGEWRDDGKGGRSWRQMSPGKHYIRVSGRLPHGEIVHSRGVAFFGEQRSEHDFVLEMKPGLRVEGRLDARVARPVKNGWVQLSVHDAEANTRIVRGGLTLPPEGTGIWWSYRPIAADGSFVFESIPEGEIKLIAYGDGFVSVNGNAEPWPPMPVRAIPVAGTQRPTRGVPQTFEPKRPVTAVEVATEAASTLRVVAKANGRPVRDAKIYVFPNVIQMPNGSRVFGHGYESSEAPFRRVDPLPEPVYSAISDREGVVVLRNLPTFSFSLGVQHPDFEVPLQRPKSAVGELARQIAPQRYVELDLAAGKETEIEVTLQPRGTEYLGAAR